MKLQTMLLPTGEFIFVLSEVADPRTLGLDNLRPGTDRAGAVGILAFTGPVEVENALVDDKAYRSLPLDENDQKIVSTLEAGGTFTPAGLVDTKENPELRTTAELEPELAEALAKPKAKPTVGDTVKIVGSSVYHTTREDMGVQGVTGLAYESDENGYLLVSFPHPDGHTGKWYFEPKSLEVVNPKGKPTVGDTVKIVGPSVWHDDEDHLVQGLVGVVEQINEKGQPLVKFRHPDADRRRWYFQVGSLEVVN